MRFLTALILAVCISTAALAAPRTSFDLSYGADREQKLDVYLPEKEVRNAPIIVMVHGGAWRLGDKKDEESATYKAPHYTGKGYIFVSINYRMANNTSPLRQMYDVADALKFVQSKAKEWGGDPAKTVLMGHSAGAHLAALVAVVPPELVHPIRGSVLLDGAGFDIPFIMKSQHYPFYDQVFGADEKNWQVNSPLYHLSAKTAPMLLTCSSGSEFCQNADAFMTKAKSFGTRVEMLRDTRNHQAMNMDVGKPGPYTEQIDTFIDSVVR